MYKSFYPNYCPFCDARVTKLDGVALIACPGCDFLWDEEDYKKIVKNCGKPKTEYYKDNWIVFYSSDDEEDDEGEEWKKGKK